MTINSSVEQPELGKQDNQALIDAFLRGAGITGNAPGFGPGSKLTPELMEMLGKLLAVSIRGTHDLLAKRAVVKREVNADVTMVVNRNNNPLKFLQNGDTVLLHMLRKKMPGFMDPVESMEEAFQDLRIHQGAMVAGVHAALSDNMNRFDPQTINTQVKSPGILGSILPGAQKARLWDRHVSVFNKLRAEHQQRGHPALGSAFLAAYEKEVARREEEGKRG